MRAPAPVRIPARTPARALLACSADFKSGGPYIFFAAVAFVCASRSAEVSASVRGGASVGVVGARARLFPCLRPRDAAPDACAPPRRVRKHAPSSHAALRAPHPATPTTLPSLPRTQFWIAEWALQIREHVVSCYVTRVPGGCIDQNYYINK